MKKIKWSELLEVLEYDDKETKALNGFTEGLQKILDGYPVIEGVGGLGLYALKQLGYTEVYDDVMYWKYECYRRPMLCEINGEKIHVYHQDISTLKKLLSLNGLLLDE